MATDSKASVSASAALGLDHELRIHDLELAVLELARVVERLVVGGKHWKGEERQLMLTAVDNARALATPENDDDPEPEPAAAGGFLTPAKRAEIAFAHATADTTSRYWIDFLYGKGMGTNDRNHVVAEFRSGGVVSVFDRASGAYLVRNGIAEQPLQYSDEVAEAA